jgi:hypothetical protein
MQRCSAGEEREQPRNDRDVRRWPAGGPAVELGVGVAVIDRFIATSTSIGSTASSIDSTGPGGVLLVVASGTGWPAIRAASAMLRSWSRRWPLTLLWNSVAEVDLKPPLF